MPAGTHPRTKLNKKCFRGMCKSDCLLLGGCLIHLLSPGSVPPGGPAKQLRLSGPLAAPPGPSLLSGSGSALSAGLFGAALSFSPIQQYTLSPVSAILPAAAAPFAPSAGLPVASGSTVQASEAAHSHASGMFLHCWLAISNQSFAIFAIGSLFPMVSLRQLTGPSPVAAASQVMDPVVGNPHFTSQLPAIYTEERAVVMQQQAEQWSKEALLLAHKEEKTHFVWTHVYIKVCVYSPLFSM